jgi:hypothetical protein
VVASALGQPNYIPFPTSSVEWVDDSSSAFTFNQNHFRPKGDSMINGINYTILTEIVSSQNGPVPTFSAEEIIGFYRNDSANKKVFFLPKDSTTEELFYDFDLAIGDTLAATYFMRLKGSGDTFIVDTIGDTSFVDGVLRKTYKYSCSSCFGQKNILVEGIGTLTGLTSSFNGFIGVSITERLCCNKRSGAIVYDECGCLPLPVGLTDHAISKVSFNIQPNPSNGRFIVDFVGLYQDLKVIEVFNLAGQKLDVEVTAQSSNRAELFINQGSGVYLVRIGSKSKKVMLW